jgi:hypothetical protein
MIVIGKPKYLEKNMFQCEKFSLKFPHVKVKQSRYKPGVAQRVPRS